MINIGKYIEIAINWLTEHFARFDVIMMGRRIIDAFKMADLDSVLCDDFGLGIVGLVQGRKRSRRVHGIGSIVNLRNGFLGGNDADFGLGTVFYHHRLDDRSSVRNLDRTQ